MMVSGMRALKDYQEKQRCVTEVSVALSAKPEKIGEAVLHAKEQQMKLRENLNRIQAVYMKGKLEAVRPEDKAVLIFEEELDTVAVRNFINDAMAITDGVCGAFVGNDTDGYRYVMGSSKVDVRGIAKTLNERFQGRGGGKPEMVQGSLNGTQDDIGSAMKELTEGNL